MRKKLLKFEKENNEEGLMLNSKGNDALEKRYIQLMR